MDDSSLLSKDKNITTRSKRKTLFNASTMKSATTKASALMQIGNVCYTDYVKKRVYEHNLQKRLFYMINLSQNDNISLQEIINAQVQN